MAFRIRCQRVALGLALMLLAFSGQPGCSRDCGFSASGSAWVDTNANGIREAGEPPLPGVAFHLDDTLNGYLDVVRAPSLTDSHGDVSLGVRQPGCPRVRMEVYPEVPEGYRLTTAARLAAASGQTCSFGFAYLPGTPNVTPPPPAPICTTYRIGAIDKYELQDLAIGPDGSVWAGTDGNGVARYLAAEDRWVTYRARDGLADDHVRVIAVGLDGKLWFGTAGGVSRYDGSQWCTFTATAGLVDNNVRGIACAPDGTVWFATAKGVSHFDPFAGSWQCYTRADGLVDDSVTGVAVTADGSVWMPTSLYGISRLAPGTKGDIPKWVQYARLGGNLVPCDRIADMAAGANGACWFTCPEGLMRHDAAPDTWTLYDWSSTNDAFGGPVQALATAPDGSLWVAANPYRAVLYHFVPGDAGGKEVWREYDERDGLPKVHDEGLRSVAVAAEDEIWVCTKEMVTRLRFPRSQGQ